MSGPLADLVAEAAELLQQHSGGQSMCAVAKSGRAVPSAKYAEGRWAALRELERAVQAGTAHDEALAAVTRGWRSQLAAVQARSAGPDWIAYRSGGCDALEDLVGEDGADGLSRGHSSKLIGP